MKEKTNTDFTTGFFCGAACTVIFAGLVYLFSRPARDPFSKMTKEQLEELMWKHANNDDHEKAAGIRDYINTNFKT